MKTIRKSAMRRCLPILLIAAGMSSCGQFCPTAVDYRRFEKTPDLPSSRIWRAVAKSNPWTESRSFHGRWGGPGNEGGPPIDEMDEACRRHDLVYHLARSGCCLRAADAELARALESVDVTDLDDDAIAFRRRAIAFLRSPWARIIGKPCRSHFMHSEVDGNHFMSPSDVVAFFDLGHPGMPETES